MGERQEESCIIHYKGNKLGYRENFLYNPGNDAMLEKDTQRAISTN